MNLKDSALKILEYAVYVTIVSIILEKIRFNRNPSQRSIFRFIHYYCLITFVGFVFIVDKKYDFIYLMLAFIMNIQWEMNENRCILSDIETTNKEDRDNAYHPYFEVFVGKHTDILVMLQLVLMIYNFYIIFRS